MRESVPFPFYLGIVITVYCFLAGSLYVFVKGPQGRIFVWSDWLFYSQVYLTGWALMPLVLGIHENYTKGTQKMSHHASKISYKVLYMGVVIMIWRYFSLNDSRVVFWWLSVTIHYTLVRFMCHVHPLVFLFLTRVSLLAKKVMATTFFVAYFGGIFVSYTLRMEILFHHFYIELIVIAIALQVPVFTKFCNNYDNEVIKKVD